MTEQEWLASDDPTAMLAHLRSGYTGIVHGASERKLRLFMCACCRSADWFGKRPISASREHVMSRLDAAEKWIDGEGPQPKKSMDDPTGLDWVIGSQNDACEAAADWCRGDWDSISFATRATLLREIVGNPFRPVTFDAAACWSYDVMRLSQVAYRDRDWAALPILADAMEDAGCDDAVILEHLRGPGPHVRGCWVLDLILGKE